MLCKFETGHFRDVAELGYVRYDHEYYINAMINSKR